jgi:hypothetical protein
MAFDLTDKTSNGNDLTNNSVAEYTASLPFAACTLAADFIPASTSNFSRADTTSLSLTGNFTLETWVQFDATPEAGAAMCMMSKFAANYSYIFELRHTGGALQLWSNYSSDGSATSATGVNWTPSLSTWYHVAVTLAAATSKVNYYVDGSLQGTEQTGTLTSVFNGTQAFIMGLYNDGANDNDKLDGQMTDGRVWNVVRTQAEIDANKATHLTGSESGLVGYWPLHSLASASVPGGGLQRLFNRQNILSLI